MKVKYQTIIFNFKLFDCKMFLKHFRIIGTEKIAVK